MHSPTTKLRHFGTKGLGTCDDDNLLYDSCDNDSVSSTAEHSRMSLQKAPSWFDQYGTFKNGQILLLVSLLIVCTHRIQWID